MNFLSICSGIEAASVAWKALGWRAVGFSEIEPFPCAVLAHHYPYVPNFGDMLKFEEWPNACKCDDSVEPSRSGFMADAVCDIAPARRQPSRARSSRSDLRNGGRCEQCGGISVDLVCGGTPCQAFSVAGKRGGMDDERGQLAVTFVEIVAKYRPRWVVWENVPGVFSSGGGADFGCFLGALTGRAVCTPADGWGNSGAIEGIADAYGVAWRTLDAQYFGVPQRRRRVFVVGHLGDWRPAAAVLFERESLCGHPPPGREAGKGTAPTLSARTKGSGGLGTDFDCDGGLIFDASEDGTGRGAPIVPIAFNHQSGGSQCMISPQVDSANALQRCQTQAVAFGSDETAGTLRANQGSVWRSNGTPVEGVAIHNMQVRRLTPRECERLQGFPDDYTRIPWRKSAAEDCPDGPRYKALGNSWAVPVARWVGRRIALVDELLKSSAVPMDGKNE